MKALPIAPIGINHLVLNVRDIEKSHRFWTEIIGYKQVGELKKQPRQTALIKMRFYAGAGNHHDLALVENPELPEPPADWKPFGMRMAVNHIAITYPNRDAWLSQLSYLQEQGVRFNQRIEHGMTHSLYVNDPDGYGVELLYDLPREVWEGDIDEALNYAEFVQTEGADALKDRVDVPRFGSPASKVDAMQASKAKRQSIDGGKPRHLNPIPNVCRIGDMAVSSVIVGTNPGTRDFPESFEAQLANVFKHIRSDVEALGGSVDDIIRVTFWVRDPASQRAALNDGWAAMFPDASSRPSRHTQVFAGEGRALLQADFMAVLSAKEWK